MIRYKVGKERVRAFRKRGSHVFGSLDRQMKLSPTTPLRALKGLRVRLTDSLKVF